METETYQNIYGWELRKYVEDIWLGNLEWQKQKWLEGLNRLYLRGFISLKIYKSARASQGVHTSIRKVFKLVWGKYIARDWVKRR